MWDWSENKIKFLLIRHGATKANREHRYLGRTDESLSTEGVKELREAIYRGCYPKVDYLFSSPLKRCLKTANILYPAEAVTIIPDFQEINFGIFEGKNYKDLQGDERYQAWIDSNGTLPFPEGESREEFLIRCEKGFYCMLEKLKEQLLEPVSKKNNQITVGLILHGGTIMALLSNLCGGNYFDYQVLNGRGYVCELDYHGGKARLEILEKI
ncbi:MAG: histidine phosphatase family protein [Lachnospiraceae bacterium]|nr:histidine phosphatase family protein [Lachnospiraceae bacterium]